ncbi:MAG: hypothetical protein V1827_04140 [Candidatus Micrarchaeota archaeon]
MRHQFMILIVVVLLSGAAFAAADCAASAYRKACTQCEFDEDGMIDKACQSTYQSGGTSCVSMYYPIMSAKYAKGECPAVDACASELQSCVAQYSSGNDKEDCQEGSVGVCYAAADSCVRSAAVKCGEIENPCPGSSASFILLLAGIGFARLKR